MTARCTTLPRLLALFTVLCATAPGQQYSFQLMTGPNAPKDAHQLHLGHTGRLWIGASDGLYLYDGQRFFHMRDYGGPASGIRQMVEDKNGALWIASGDGIQRYFGGTFEHLVRGAGEYVYPLDGSTVFAMVGPGGKGTAEDADKRPVRMRLSAKGWSEEQLDPWGTRGFVERDHQGNFVFVCGQTTYCEVSTEALLKPGQPVIKRFPLPVTRSLPIRVVRDGRGCLWLHQEVAVDFMCPGSKEATRVPSSVASQSVMAQVRETGSGEIMLPGANGISIGRPGRWRTAFARNGAPSQPVDLVEGRDGTVWIAAGAGLVRFAHPFRLEYWTERDGMVEGSSVLRAGGATLAAGSGGIVALSPKRDRWVSVLNEDPFQSVMHLYPAQGGRVYASLYRDGLAEITPSGQVIRSLAEPRSGMRLAGGEKHGFWFAGSNGIRRIAPAGKTFATSQHEPVQEGGNSLDVEVDAQGRVWSCHGGGLVWLEAGVWRRVSEKDGLIQNGCRSLAVEPNGNVWYGYLTAPAFSLIRINGDARPTIRHFRTDEGVGKAQTHFLDRDARGRLWRGAVDGFYVAEPDDAARGQWIHLNEADGLPAVNANQQGFWQDPDGSVWLAALYVLMHLELPADFARPLEAPATWISSISVDDAIHHLADAIDALPNRKPVQIHMGSLQSDRRNALQFRYRVLPGSEDWQVSRSPVLSIDSLSRGDYTVQVQARLASGPWSTAASKRLRVLPAWWQTVPAVVGTTLGLGTAGWLLWRRRVRNAQIAESLPDLSEWRLTALMTDIQDLIGTVLDDRYELLRVVARGGFATVIEGRDIVQGSRCAVKIFRRELLEDDWLTRRFDQEVEALGRIRHPHIVGILGHGSTAEGVPYLVMEFVEGITLRERIASGALPAPNVAALLRQICSGLRAMHQKNVYHRDLKPDNLMLRAADDSIVIIDFSIALVRDPTQTIHGLSRAAGTIDYMAPEQAVGFAGPMTDLYALSRIAIEMLTGRPFAEIAPGATLDLPAEVRRHLPPLLPTVSPVTIEMLAAAVEFDPHKRPTDAVRFAEVIANDLEGR